MPCSPASIRIMWKPKYFHEMITNNVSITMLESPSQSWTRAPRPTPRQRASTKRVRLQEQPEHDAGDGLRRGRTAGRTAAGTTARPRNRRLSMTRERQRERDLERERQDDDRTLLRDGLPEQVARQRHLVVLEPDEVGQRLRARSTCTGCSGRPGRSGQRTKTRVQRPGPAARNSAIVSHVERRGLPGATSRVCGRRCRHRGSTEPWNRAGRPGGRPAPLRGYERATRRSAYWVAAASVIAWQTFSGVDGAGEQGHRRVVDRWPRVAGGRLVEVQLHELGLAATGEDRLEVRVGDGALGPDGGRRGRRRRC